MRALVVWEDRYFTTLGPFVKKRLAALAPADHAAFPQVLFHTAYGAGGFKRYVSSTWDQARANGLPLDKGPIDHLICVVDGDKLHEQIHKSLPPPPTAADVPAWLATAEQAWEEHLRALCDNAPRGTVHGRVLRWSKESLVLAGYDRDAVKRHLGIDTQSAAVQAHLDRCVPAPAHTPRADFTNTFRKPLQCLMELDDAQRGKRASGLAKNAPELDDALRDLVREEHLTIAERVPEIDRLATLLWQLAAKAPLLPAAPPLLPAAGDSTKNKRPRRDPKR